MTYTILSLASGNILESHPSEEGVLHAAYRMTRAEPAATASLALATFDDDGTLVDSLDGDALAERLGAYAAAYDAMPA
jgi:hypothetical protein